MTSSDDQSWFKAYFLGPKSENESFVRGELQSILGHWFRWRQDLFPDDVAAITLEERTSAPFLKHREKLAQNLRHLNELLSDELPKYTPRYMGHMVSELSLPAIFGHFAALLHNPNNTSKEAAKVTSVIETEAIAMLAHMVGFDATVSCGHFTSGGTIANFEAIWRARFRLDHWMSLALYLAEEKNEPFHIMDAAHMGWDRYFELNTKHDIPVDATRKYSLVASNPFEAAALISKHLGQAYHGPVVLVPGNKHFSWSKGVSIFGLGEASFWTIPLDDMGKLDVKGLEALVEKAERDQRPVLMVVSVAGTTEAGEVDPVDGVVTYLEDYRTHTGRDIWHHVDAAYGGFMCTMLGGETQALLKPETARALHAIRYAHSVTLDPHKLGYVPYSCGAFLTRDKACYSVSTFKAPYLDRKDLGDSVWASTMEGSRSGAGATATWLTGKSIGFDPEGFGRIVGGTMTSARSFRTALEEALPFVRVKPPVDTNLVCFSLANEGDSLALANEKTNRVFEAFTRSENFSISRTTLGTQDCAMLIEKHVGGFGGKMDADHLVLMRVVFMNPFWAVAQIRDNLTLEFIAELQAHYQNLA